MGSSNRLTSAIGSANDMLVATYHGMWMWISVGLRANRWITRFQQCLPSNHWDGRPPSTRLSQYWIGFHRCLTFKARSVGSNDHGQWLICVGLYLIYDILFYLQYQSMRMQCWCVSEPPARRYICAAGLYHTWTIVLYIYIYMRLVNHQLVVLDVNLK